MRSGDKIYLWRQVQNQRRVPGFPVFHLCLFYHGKSPVLPSSRNRASVQRLCAMPRIVQSSISLHLASLVCVPCCTLAGAVLASTWPPWLQVAASPTWMLQKVGTNRMSMYYQGRERERQASSLLAGYIIWGLGRTRCFLKLTNQLPKLL